MYSAPLCVCNISSVHRFTSVPTDRLAQKKHDGCVGIAAAGCALLCLLTGTAGGCSGAARRSRLLLLLGLPGAAVAIQAAAAAAAAAQAAGVGGVLVKKERTQVPHFRMRSALWSQPSRYLQEWRASAEVEGAAVGLLVGGGRRLGVVVGETCAWLRRPRRYLGADCGEG